MVLVNLTDASGATLIQILTCLVLLSINSVEVLIKVNILKYPFWSSIS